GGERGARHDPRLPEYSWPVDALPPCIHRPYLAQWPRESTACTVTASAAMAAATLAPIAVHSSTPTASVRIGTPPGRTGGRREDVRPRPPGPRNVRSRPPNTPGPRSAVCYRGAVGLGTSTRLGARGGAGQLSTTTPVSSGAVSTWTPLGAP